MVRVAVSETSVRSPRASAIRGALWVVFGVVESALLLLAFQLPITVSHMILVLTGFVVLDGVVVLVEAAGVIRPGRRWLWPTCRALIGIGAGIAIALLARRQALTIFAWWAIATGGLEAADSRSMSGGRQAPRLIGLICVGFGLFVLLGPVRDPAVLILVCGAFGVIVGILRLWTAKR